MSDSAITPALGTTLCATCATRFEAPMLGDFAYGDFLMWSPGGEVRHVAAVIDPVFREFGQLVRARYPDLDAAALADLIQRNFGRIACDPDAKGLSFSITGPFCPTCGGTKMQECEVIQPLRRSPEIPPVENEAWNRLSPEEKAARIAGPDGPTFYRRSETVPEWEPIPWKLAGAEADAQELGFYRRAIRPIQWLRVPILDFPAEGLLGMSRDWYRKRDVDFYAHSDGEDLILWENLYSGFPDPPRWGLATREGHGNGEWQPWGHFDDLPAPWIVPGV